ncbi:MAG: type II toxin-antitoxin system HicB family antitoxin [bacterium]|nr:type II toxin-antitoxin system HicB family antitoxin [bacterium]
MISSFIEAKLHSASYKILPDKTYFGEIKGLRGVWANAKTLEKCRSELQEVLEDWLVLKIKSGDTIPGLRFDFDRRKEFIYA